MPWLLQNKSEVEPWLAPSFSCSLADGKLLIFVIQKLSMTTINLWYDVVKKSVVLREKKCLDKGFRV